MKKTILFPTLFPTLFALMSLISFQTTAQISRESNNRSDYKSMSADAPEIKFSVLTAGDIAFHDNLTQATFKDTVKNGDQYYFEVVVQNFSQVRMDSVYLKYYTNDDATNFQLRLIKPLDPGEAYTLPVLTIPTDNLSGSQVLNLELNPDAVMPESDYDNNILTVPFYVRPTIVSSTDLLNSDQNQIYNYPNPVSGSTRFHVNLGSQFSDTESISINIYDLRGQLVKSIQSTDNNGQGKFNTETWNAADEGGNQLSTGIYFYNVTAEDNNGQIKTVRANSNIQIVN